MLKPWSFRVREGKRASQTAYETTPQLSRRTFLYDQHVYLRTRVSFLRTHALSSTTTTLYLLTRACYFLLVSP